MAPELPFRDGNAGFSLILKRNCSISPVGLAGVFAALEIAALVAAYVAYARRAADYERIELAGQKRLRI